MASVKRRSEAIWKEISRRWQINVQKEGERRSFYSSTPGRKGKHEAENAADEWLETGTEDMVFSAAWAEYLKYQKKHSGTSNYTQNEYIGRLHLLPALQNKKLSRITPKLWQNCIDSAAAKGLSRRTCKNVKMVIGAFVTYCRKARWKVDAPERGDIIVPKSAPVGKRKILQPGALTTLFTIDYITKYNREEHSFFIHAWRFLVLTGLRRGELCGLENADINGSVLNIERSINAQGEETRGKNDNARRVIELSAFALKVLEDQRTELADQGIESRWVFPDEEGSRLDSNHLYSMWSTYRDQHGLGCSLHELRHTFISVVRTDMPMPLLKGVVGHSEDMDTDGTYGHEVDGEKVRAAQIVDEAFSRYLPSVVKSVVSDKKEASKSQ